ncbi:multidrug ABC transporter ATPase [Rummeliibacillus sp. NPDC094406]|uniref:multidrug ABC transporter ATPase n=1 Tax=Rummeliibacillus sp. NPDC094406 TaxID=3364511 RepID=UPI0037F33CA2
MSKDKKQIENGSMATSFEDVQALGKQMEKRREETELERVGRDQDPEQFDDK